MPSTSFQANWLSVPQSKVHMKVLVLHPTPSYAGVNIPPAETTRLLIFVLVAYQRYHFDHWSPIRSLRCLDGSYAHFPILARMDLRDACQWPFCRSRGFFP